LQLPITLAYNFGKKRVVPFIGVGVVPTYILSANLKVSSVDYYEPNYSYELNDNLLDKSKYEPFRRIRNEASVVVGASFDSNTKIKLSYSVGNPLEYFNKMPDGEWCATGYLNSYQNKSLNISIYYNLDRKSNRL